MNFLDRTGLRYGRLLVTGSYERRKVCGATRIFWACQCDCGKSVAIMGLLLGNGNTRSCGCLKLDLATTHDMSHTPEYRTWAGMIQRCTNPKTKRFPDYGGRGIKICDRWLVFENFYADMGDRPSSGHSLDRYPDNDGNYEPGNCRWATRSQQQLNKRPNNTENLPRGDDHWTRRDPERARRVSATNIRKAHGRLEANPNAKLTMEIAEQIRSTYAAEPNLTLVQLSSRFGIGKETARKVIRRLAW